LSGLGEELFFRGFLVPVIGVAAQAAIFGLAHQLRGPSRWVWVGWATLVGLCLGLVFALTGSLVGPIVTHVLVNGYNLAFLRDHDPTPRRRLGGLLAPSDLS
jgi:membrane protease YdiL (CAAX protease family)